MVLSPKKKISKNNDFRIVISLLQRKDKFKLMAIAGIQSSLGLLDLAGIAVLGLLSTLAISGIQNQPPGNKVSFLLNIIGFDNANLQTQISVLGLLGAVLLISKTLISILFLLKMNKFLSNKGALISVELFRKLLQENGLRLTKVDSQSIIFAVTSGVSAIMMGIVGTTVGIFVDFILLTFLLVGLFVVNALVAVETLLFFTAIGLSLYFLLHKKSQELGLSQAKFQIRNNTDIREAIETQREIYVLNKEEYFVQKYGKTRYMLASVLAKTAFLPNVSKYVIESGLVIGSLLICATQFYISDAKHAIATLTIFLAAGSRIAPAILRVQQNFLTIRNTMGGISSTLDLLKLSSKKIIEERNISEIPLKNSSAPREFSPTVQIKDVSFSYPDSSTLVLDKIGFSVKAGTKVAIVGPTGSGKSTLMDLILGINNPLSGSVRISEVIPSEARKIWPGKISYVPQKVNMISDTIKQNIAFGQISSEISNYQMKTAIEVAQMQDLFITNEVSLETLIGDGGRSLSGGQKQRIGIARAIYSEPELLILDESTSALDGLTELNFSSYFDSVLKGKTIIMVTHRLSILRHFDHVIYLEDGKVLSTGSFEEVRNTLPKFDEQARALGL